MTSDFNLNGLWHNQYGSEMKLEVDLTGRIQGKFRTAVGRSETKDKWQDNWFDLVGFINKDIISFVVNFVTSGAMSVFTGRLISVECNGDVINKIEALSYTNYNLPKEEHWRSVVVASVIYEQGPVK